MRRTVSASSFWTKRTNCWVSDVCLIVDANAAGEFLAKSSAIRDWLGSSRGEPRLVAAGLLRRELARLSEVRRFLVQLDRAGRLRSADEHRLRREEERLRASSLCGSNDSHVLALAIVTGARTLATFDQALIDDFRNAGIVSGPRGSVYRDPGTHAHLLRHTPSCGVQSTGSRRRRRVR
jgi:predicted nucleic acid-binding protein